MHHAWVSYLIMFSIKYNILKYMYINIKVEKYNDPYPFIYRIMYLYIMRVLNIYLVVLMLGLLSYYISIIIFYVDEVYCTHVVIVILFGTFDFKNGYR